MIIRIEGVDLPSNATSVRPAKGGIIASGSELNISLPSDPVRYLVSGWQSWSLTSWVDADHRFSPMRPSLMHPMQTDPKHVRERVPNGSWYGAVEIMGGKSLFLGGLGLESHVKLEGKTLSGSYETGEGEWFVASGNEDEFMNQYAKMLGERFGTGRKTPSPRVWCSWYSLYTEIYEQQLLKILKDLGTQDNKSGLPFDIFQIDDGWQVNIGEWEPNQKFPSGMDHLAAKIKDTGRKAGLWLAPLLVVRKTSIFRDHQDWLLRDENGKLVSCGFNWGKELFALDTTHPGALEWLAALMKKVRSWGYDYVKLDFLYAGALPSKRTVDMPREAAYRNGLKTIRGALGDAYLLTCGAPILPSIGLCDGIRIGPDVAGHFISHRDDALLANYAIPGGRNAIRTTSNRIWLQPLVQTDPDVVYFGSQMNSLTPEQKSLFQDLAQICKFKASSDVPAWLTDAERSALKAYLQSDPVVRKNGGTTYQIDDRQVDFGPYISLPGTPGAFDRILGFILGNMANIPALMKIFDMVGKKNLIKTLKQNPV